MISCRNGLLLLLLTLSVSPIVKGERLPLKYYTVADGLAHNEVNKIVRDSRGFLWFCTSNGLSRFDGYSFTNYGTDQGLPDPYVNDFLETSSGEFYVATNGGLVLFNPKGVANSRIIDANQSTQTTPLFAVIKSDDDDRRALSTTVLLADRNGQIWCGTMKGLFQLAKSDAHHQLVAVPIGLPTEYARQSYVYALLEDHYGTLWIGTANGLYRRWPDGHSAHYGKSTGLPDDDIFALLEDRKGDIWAGTPRAGVFRLAISVDLQPPIITRSYTEKNGLSSNWIFSLYESADGHLWAGGNRGLYEFLPASENITAPTRSYSERNGLNFGEIVSLTEDRDGNLWLGTNTAGAMKLARKGFTSFDGADGIKSVYWFFESGSNELYAHGDVVGDKRASIFEGAKLDLLNPGPVDYHRRLGRFDGQRFEWLIPDVLRNRYLGWSDKPTVLRSHTGEWWIGTGHGVFLFPPVNSFDELKASKPLGFFLLKQITVTMVYCLYEDSRGDLWMSATDPTGNALGRWERATREFHDMGQTQGLPSLNDRLPTAFQEDAAGNIWVGFSQGGVARYRGGRFTVFSNTDGVPAGRINDLYLDRAGNLWIGSGLGGVGRSTNPAAEHPTFSRYTTAEGLSSNYGSSIIEDLYGRVYIGTGQGLDRLDPQSGRVKHYTTADGLAPGVIPVAFRTHDGDLWFGTSQGISHLVPEPPEVTPRPPPIVVTALRLSGSAQQIAANGETDVHLPDLPPGRNQLQIDFVGLSFAFGESLRYQFRLEGADQDWGAATAQRTVNYANLAPGHYHFAVRAITSDGSISQTPAIVTFTVLPHVWQRWWFLTLAAFLLSLLGYSWYRSRMKHLLRIERVRTRIAADLHDDIGTNLTRIAILSEVANSQLNDANLGVANPLSSIARISRESVASMSDIVWAINPRRESLLDLVLRMRKFATEVLAGRRIEVEFNAPEADQDQKLSADLRRDVFLIFKEALNNAVRHSNCTKVCIQLLFDRHSLVLKIEDNGCGFESTGTSDGHGLTSMQRRAKALGGQLELLSTAGVGTRILLRVPR